MGSAAGDDDGLRRIVAPGGVDNLAVALRFQPEHVASGKGATQMPGMLAKGFVQFRPAHIGQTGPVFHIKRIAYLAAAITAFQQQHVEARPAGVYACAGSCRASTDNDKFMLLHVIRQILFFGGALPLPLRFPAADIRQIHCAGRGAPGLNEECMRLQFGAGYLLAAGGRWRTGCGFAARSDGLFAMGAKNRAAHLRGAQKTVGYLVAVFAGKGKKRHDLSPEIYCSSSPMTTIST